MKHQFFVDSEGELLKAVLDPRPQVINGLEWAGVRMDTPDNAVMMHLRSDAADLFVDNQLTPHNLHISVAFLKEKLGNADAPVTLFPDDFLEIIVRDLTGLFEYEGSGK
jgi:hypothetical protein